MFIIFVLADECDGRLSVVFIQHWKIDIVDEPNELVLSYRSVGDTSSFFDLLLEVNLQ